MLNPPLNAQIFFGKKTGRQSLIDGHFLQLPPRDFIYFYRGANSFDSGIGQRNASGGQSRIAATQMFVSRFARDDAAASGKALQAAREIHFAAKHGVVREMR